ncbi:MAG TPA: tripartite tricarboxylate transporter TctB family protein [Burkholderiaceae bacterium]|nr:tripartite tricarboxylate transporter TctB family protein [Burkholderiaceae bacterium]
MYKQKYYSAGFMLLIGVATALGSWGYNMGTMARMGPGYFPLLLGVLLAFIGILIAVTPDSPDEIRADAEHEPFVVVARRRLRPWGAAVGGVLAFIVVGRYGLVPATFALIFCSALGDPKNSLKASFWLAAGVAAFAVAAFHYGLQLQFPLFSWG